MRGLLSAMTKLCVADCYTKLLQVQRDLKNKNGPTKANLADELEPIIAYLKERLPKNNGNLLPPPDTMPDELDISEPKATPKRAEAQEAARPRIYPRLSDLHDEPTVNNLQDHNEPEKQHEELFASSSYRHEINRKDRFVTEVKKCRKAIVNKQSIAIVDSHPNWITLHKHAPEVGIIQVGGLCFPSAAAGLDSLGESGLSFPHAKRVLIALGSNDIAHASSAHHDISNYGDSWLPYFSCEITKRFPNATIKFLLPFSSKTVPQHYIDMLQQQLIKTFPKYETLQSPFYTPNDFGDHMHLNSQARNNYTTFLAKILTNGNLRNIASRETSIHQRKPIPLLNMAFDTRTHEIHRNSNPTQYHAHDYNGTHAQVTNNNTFDLRGQPNRQGVQCFPNISFPPAPIPRAPMKTYAQAVAHGTNTANPAQHILNQLTALLPKLIDVINYYQ